MGPYILRRALGVLPVLVIASVLIFLIIHLIPGDPVYSLLPADPSPEQVRAVREAYGFDDPLVTQYVRWVNNLLSGNLGRSISIGAPVSKILRARLGVTFQLAIAVFIVALSISFPLGIRAGLYPEGFLNRRFLSFYSSLGLAMPTFWIGILLILLFGVFLGVLPTSGFKSVLESPLQGIRYLILPAFTQAFPASVIYSNFIASSVEEVHKAEYVTAAIAKGLPRRTIIIKHILKNSLIPVVTIAAIMFGQIMAGLVITESVFGIPGLGQLLVRSIAARDYAVLQANLMLLVVVFIVANFVADLINAWLDPRVRYD